MKEISVVINARLGSSRVPNKLMRTFADSSLIEIALQKLDQMDFFQHRFLAAAEQELINLLKDYKTINVLKRKNKAVIKGVNPLEDTFAHYLDVPTEYIFVFNPCLPCIEVSTIRKAYDYFQNTDFNSYTAAHKTGDWVFNSEGLPLTNSDPKNATTNKNMSFYKGCHAFHIHKKSFFKEEKILWKFEKNDPHLILIPTEEAVDVDTVMEFRLAEKIYLDKINNSSEE